MVVSPRQASLTEFGARLSISPQTQTSFHQFLSQDFICANCVAVSSESQRTMGACTGVQQTSCSRSVGPVERCTDTTLFAHLQRGELWQCIGRISPYVYSAQTPLHDTFRPFCATTDRSSRQDDASPAFAGCDSL